MNKLSEKISDLIICDLMIKTEPQHYKIYKKQKKIKLFTKLYNVLAVLAFFPVFIYFLMSVRVNMAIPVGTSLLIFFIAISAIFFNTVHLTYIERIFNIKEKSKSLKKTLVNIMDNENHSTELKDEAVSLIKIINNEKEIEKIIDRTDFLDVRRFSNYFENEQQEPINALERKSLNVEKNLDLIRQQIYTKQS